MTTSMIIVLVCFGLVMAYGIYKAVTNPNKDEQDTQTSGNPSPAPNSAELGEVYERGLDPTKFADLTLYTLKKCVHCGRLEKYLEENSIPFSKVQVDDFSGEPRQELMKKVKKYNERGSFPTLVGPDEVVTVGFREWNVYDAFMRYTTDAEKLAKYEESLKK